MGWPAGDASNIAVKMFPGFFEVIVFGPKGVKGFYKIPLAPRGMGGMMVANFVSCSIGRLHNMATVGIGFRPVHSVNVICRDPRITLEASSPDTLEGK
jgi:hypothetical protein